MHSPPIVLGFLIIVRTYVLRWIDGHPWSYWALAGTTSGLLLLLIGFGLFHTWSSNPIPRTRDSKGLRSRLLNSPGLFLTLAIGTMLAFRWPQLFAGPLGNPDEGQLASAALSYLQDPVPWRSVDMHTSGPVNAWLLWPTLLATGETSYSGIRVVSLISHLGIAAAVYGILRRIGPEYLARLAALPGITFVALSSHWDFMQYSSEQPSILLCSVGAWLLAEGIGWPGISERRRLVLLALAGFLLGLVPLAKLQAVPIAFMIGTIGLVAAFRRLPGLSLKERCFRPLVLATASIIPLLLIALVLTIYGLWSDFRISYVDANATYSESMASARFAFILTFASQFAPMVPEFSRSFWALLGFALLTITLIGFWRVHHRALLVGAWGITLAAFAAVIHPVREFPHYLQLLILPLTLLAGLSVLVAVQTGERDLSGRSRTIWRWSVAGMFLMLSVLPQLRGVTPISATTVGRLVEIRKNLLHPVSTRLLALAQPGDTMTIWGWFPRLYLETGLPQGTHEAHSFYQIESLPHRDYFRQRYLDDLKRNQPAFFVDVVSPSSFGYVDRETHGLATWPELAAYVERNYRLAEEVDGIRIYLRADRALP